MWFKLVIAGGLAAVFVSTGVKSAPALPPLEDNHRVTREFLAASIGDEIRKNCPTISARLWRVWRKASQLEDYALSLGYSDADIRAMRENPDAKARLKAMRDAYLAANGVVAGDSDSYCRLGHDEIEKNTLTGWLLRAR